MSNDYDNEQLVKLKNKINIFSENNIPIHVYMKDGQFRRGQIIKIYDDYFIIQERVLGEIPLFFVDINGIDVIRVKK